MKKVIVLNVFVNDVKNLRLLADHVVIQHGLYAPIPLTSVAHVVCHPGVLVS